MLWFNCRYVLLINFCKNQTLDPQANESLLLVGCNTAASTLQLFWTEKWEINLKQPPDKLSRSKRSVPWGQCMNHGEITATRFAFANFFSWVRFLLSIFLFSLMVWANKENRRHPQLHSHICKVLHSSRSLFTTPMCLGHQSERCSLGAQTTVQWSVFRF